MKKKINLFNTLLIGVLMCATVSGINSCDRDYDDSYTIPDKEVIEELVLSENSIAVIIDDSYIVDINSGNGDYIATPVNGATVKVEVVGNTLVFTGLAKGTTTVGVKDAKNATTTISVSVDLGMLNINTLVKYSMTVLELEKANPGNGWYYADDNTDLTLITCQDYWNGAEVHNEIKSFFDTYCGEEDGNVIVLPGYGYYDLGPGKKSLALKPTTEENEDGTRVLNVMGSSIAAYMGSGGYQTYDNGYAYYDYTDGSITVYATGYYDWWLSFTYHRKFTPVTE